MYGPVGSSGHWLAQRRAVVAFGADKYFLRKASAGPQILSSWQQADKFLLLPNGHRLAPAGQFWCENAQYERLKSGTGLFYFSTA
jgi:hypothetical protein